MYNSSRRCTRLIFSWIRFDDRNNFFLSLLKVLSNCWRTLASHSSPSLRSTCTSTSWCAWTPRGKKEGKRICVQQPPDLAVSRNSSAINDNRFKYQFSACIELRGECTPRGYGIPSIFRSSSSFWEGEEFINGVCGQEGRSCQAGNSIHELLITLWKSIVDECWMLDFARIYAKCLIEKFLSSIPSKFSLLKSQLRFQILPLSLPLIPKIHKSTTLFVFQFSIVLFPNYFTFRLSTKLPTISE